jgi:hypothetical protein
MSGCDVGVSVMISILFRCVRECNLASPFMLYFEFGRKLCIDGCLQFRGRKRAKLDRFPFS